MNVHDFLEMIHKHDCPACGGHTEEDSELCEDCLRELARAGESGFSMKGVLNG